MTAGGGATRRRAAGWLLAIILVTVAVYAPGCDAPLQFDDDIFLHAAESGHFDRPGGLVGFARTRLIPVASLLANYRLGGEAPWGYHVVNVTVHVLATCLVFALAGALCRTPRLRGSWIADHALAVAVVAAAVFALHPVQVQAVTYVVQRATAMATAFYVAAVHCYVRGRMAQLAPNQGRAWPFFAGSLACAAGAFASKESAVSLPAALILTEWVGFGFRQFRRAVPWLLPYVALVLAIPLAWKMLAIGRGGVRVSGTPLEQLQGLLRLLVFRANPDGDVTPLQYLLTQAVVLPRYLLLIVYPVGLNVDHDVAIQRQLSVPVVAGLAGLIGWALLGAYAVRRAPLLGFAAWWFLVALSVESSVLPLRDVMVEHRLYLAMPGIGVGAGALFARAVRHRRRVAVAVTATAAVLLAVVTLHRNELWRDPIALWQDAARKSPHKARVYANVGAALHRAGRLDEATAQYCRALELDPRNRAARANLDAIAEAEAEARLEAGEAIIVEQLDPRRGGLRMRAPDPCAKAGADQAPKR